MRDDAGRRIPGGIEGSGYRLLGRKSRDAKCCRSKREILVAKCLEQKSKITDECQAKNEVLRRRFLEQGSKNFCNLRRMKLDEINKKKLNVYL